MEETFPVKREKGKHSRGGRKSRTQEISSDKLCITFWFEESQCLSSEHKTIPGPLSMSRMAMGNGKPAMSWSQKKLSSKQLLKISNREQARLTQDFHFGAISNYSCPQEPRALQPPSEWLSQCQIKHLLNKYMNQWTA